MSLPLPPGDRPALLLIVGPTASGKTDLALEVAERLEAEILCADSVQVYRYLDIGSGKATPAERARVPHHGLDLVDPDEPFDAQRYQEAADRAIADITRRGRRVVVTAGTGLYVRALLRGLLPAPRASAALRQDLLARAGGDPAALHAQLAAVDPVLAARLHPRDQPRLLRGLEVFAQTGVPLSTLQENHARGQPRYPSLQVGLRWPRAALRQRIAERCRAMIAAGLPAEVEELQRRGYGPELHARRALGYLQQGLRLQGVLGATEALEQQILQTQRYAKRQITWFGADPEVVWLDAPPDPAAVLHLAATRLGWQPRDRAAQGG